jgi:hypothetical protein
MFILACVLTAGHGHGGFLENGVEPVGWWLLVFGWMAGPVAPLLCLAWIANPLWGLSLVALWRRGYRTAVLSSGSAAALSLIPLVLLGWDSVPELRWESPIALVFGGGSLELRPGYFIWVGCQAVLVAGMSFLWLVERHAEPFAAPVPAGG